MIKKCMPLSLSIFILSIVFLPSFASTISITPINDLILNAFSYDGKEVRVIGEVIGEAMERPGGVFLNINDNGSCIGIFVSKELYSKLHITYFGNYKSIGDKVEVYGIFHKAWDKQKGEICIEAKNIKVLSLGHPRNITPSNSLLVMTGISIIFLLILSIMYRRKFGF